MKKLLLMTCAAAAVLGVCHAGVKYWDNPEFRAYDVGDYVAGAVWNYDGIRNVGETEPHSTTATTWKNLGTSGADNDMWVRYANQAGNGFANSSAPASLDPVDGRNLGFWTENGFTLTGDSQWRSDGPINSGTSYTIQMLVDAKISNQTKAKPYLMSVQQYVFAFYADKVNSRLCWGVENTSAADDPFMSGDELGYITAILNGTDKTAAFFSGTEIPTSGDGLQQFASVSGRSDNKYCLCGYTATDGFFVGTMHSYRYYKRVLTEEELAWNRVVDERRFFGRAAPLPVTNVVIATSVAGANGTEPVGCYAVDVRHAFTAPATAIVDNIEYVCTGYTVETRDGDGWSAPIFHKAALYQPCAFVANESDCVRLTWQWAKAAGLANLYTVNDYVWNGLETFYDGICNVGTNLPHSYAATNWVNLGSTGSVNNVFVQRMNASGNNWETATDLNPVGDRDPGYWTENGFRLDAEGRFRCNAPGGFNVSTNYSLQMLIDAKLSDQKTNDAYPFGANSETFAFQLRQSDNKLYWKYAASSWPTMSGDHYDYMTAIMREENKQTFFSGTTEPTSGNGYKANSSTGYSDTGFCLGGYGKTSAASLFVGTLKSFRQYDHALSAAEVAQNRKVDNWRYFGIPDVTNVVVQSTIPYLRGDEPDGAYAVYGSHTFTAPATVTVKGIEYACDGYTIETLQWEDSQVSSKGGYVWSATSTYTGTSYPYTTAAGTVRLTWLWKPVRGIRTAADYSFDDYSQAGLVWNYDGIRNQGGTDADHDSNATTWKNLGGGGAAHDLAFTDGATTGEWADDGYIFSRGPRFKGTGKVGPLKSFTVQSLVDVDIANQTGSSSSRYYIMSLLYDYFDLAVLYDDDGWKDGAFGWQAQGRKGNVAGNFSTLYFHNDSGHYDYSTAIMDYDAKIAAVFPGVVVPTSGNGFKQFDSVHSCADSGFGIGNLNGNAEGLNGTIKSIRYYDRVLTQEEIVRNRNVDSVRYFGELGVTNVLVEAGGGNQSEEGAYKVEGGWTFTATTTLNKRGETVNVERYSIEELVDGEWTNKQTHSGNSYTYTEGTSAATVRLKWLGAPLGTILVIQ